MIKRKAIVLLSLLLPLLAVGQGIVTGTVTDSLTGEALQYTSVGMAGSTVGTTTDAQGRYRLQINTSDSITLQYSFVGYRTTEWRVAVKEPRS